MGARDTISGHFGRLSPAAFLVSALIAVAGFGAGALTGRAAATATLLGGGVLRAFGGPGGVLLGLFFGSGTGLSRLPCAPSIAGEKSARNERQVVANGGVAALASVAGPVVGPDVAAAMLAGSLAAATSDTWATEIGIRVGKRPRYVLSGAPVAPGLSGGITPAGTLASVAGAGILAMLAGALFRRAPLIPVTFVGGMAGSIVDSILGELVQTKRRNPITGELTESEQCGAQPTVHASGWRWVDNDAVNLACTLSGGLVAAMLWRIAADTNTTQARHEVTALPIEA